MPKQGAFFGRLFFWRSPGSAAAWRWWRGASSRASGSRTCTRSTRAGAAGAARARSARATCATRSRRGGATRWRGGTVRRGRTWRGAARCGGRGGVSRWRGGRGRGIGRWNGRRRIGGGWRVGRAGILALVATGQQRAQDGAAEDKFAGGGQCCRHDFPFRLRACQWKPLRSCNKAGIACKN